VDALDGIGEMKNPSGPLPDPIEIVMFGHGDWPRWENEGFRIRNAKLCLELAGRPEIGRIGVVNNHPRVRRSRFEKDDTSPLRKLREAPARTSVLPVADKIEAIVPSRVAALPPPVRDLYYDRILKGWSQAGARRRLLWIADPCKVYNLRSMKGAAVVFDAIDDWEAIPEYQPFVDVISEGYRRIMERAEVIFTVSESLVKKFDGARARIVRHIPNGVDPTLFQSAGQEVAASREGSPSGPVLTYVGVMHARFSPEIISACAEAFPEATIQLVGPVWDHDDIEALRALPNVRFTGFIHHGRIPAIMKGSDVLLLPHRVTQASCSMDPLKIYEYLAAGPPIVSTKVPPITSFGDLVYAAADTGEFVRMVGQALDESRSDDAEGQRERRTKEAEQHSWKKRVDVMLADILELFHSSRSPEGGAEQRRVM